jgi:N-formylglutamate amidohydrolase
MPNPTSSQVGIVVHVPHASVAIPGHLRPSLVLDDAELEAELLRMTDRYTDELFSLRIDRAERIVFPVSRLVVDPERFPQDADEPMAARGMGAVYTRTSQGRPLRRGLTEATREKLLDDYYRPHHDALAEAVARQLERYGNCLIIDGHSFSSVPLPHEPDQEPERPQICIGTDGYHTPGWLAEAARGAFEAQGFATAVNRPFSGSLVPSAFYRKDPRVLSVMIELNRSLYMDQETGTKSGHFDGVRSVVEASLLSLAAANRSLFR